MLFYRLNCKLFELKECLRIRLEPTLIVALPLRCSSCIVVVPKCKSDKLQLDAKHCRSIAYPKLRSFLHSANLEVNQQPKRKRIQISSSTVQKENKYFQSFFLWQNLTETAAPLRLSFLAVVFIAARYFSINKPHKMYIFFLKINGRLSLLWFSAI